MRSSLSVLLVAAALPLGFAHTSSVDVVTKYVTVCEPSLSNGYVFPSTAVNGEHGGGSGGNGGAHETSPSNTGKGGSGGSGGSGSGSGNNGNAGSGSGSTATHSGSSSAYTYVSHSTYSNQTSTYGNHSSTSYTNGTQPTGSATSTSASLTSTKPTGTTATSTGTGSTYVPLCTNEATDRSAWCNGFSVDTQEEVSWPNTGRTVKYTLEITNTTMAPDGFSRQVLVVNNQYPGPTIEADWGDTLEITVINSLGDNGTSMHWHGLRQLGSCNMDGTNGVTECPIAPGKSKVYTFTATEHGTSWYHSHYSTQYGDGVVGPIVIHGPATQNYDEDLGAYPITEWYHTTVFQNALYSTYNGGSTPTADNGLINGKMVAAAGGTGGEYSKTTITKDKKYRLRLINTSVDNHFKVSLDGHSFTVITADFVPIVPYTTNTIFLAIGQRYDVIITANQAIGNYWFRASVMTSCSATNRNNGNIRSIFSYDGAAAGNPTSTAYTINDSCQDEQGLVPHVGKAVPTTNFDSFVSLDTGLTTGQDSTGANIIQWTIDGSPMNVDWDIPTLTYPRDGITTYPTDLNVLKMPNRGQWYYWIIQGSDGTPSSHPIHLHGHDFALLGTGSNTFTASAVANLNFANPPRRDVAMLPRSGWLVIAFEADNPGAWLMHCHVAWHVSQGFAAQFVEIESEIKTTMDLGSLGGEGGCDGWKTYQASAKGLEFPKDDSGL